MIIRSQDKTMILNMDCVANIYVCELEYADTKRIVYEIDTDKGILGTYSTEEKAIKVLDMICENYKECKMCESGRRQIADIEFAFQMPQDCEV